MLVRSADYPLIRSLLVHPEIYPGISDDFSPAPDKVQPIQNDAIIYLLAYDAFDLRGMFMLVPESHCVYEFHTCLLQKGRGSYGFETGRAMIRWVWENTPCMRLTTKLPEFNRGGAVFAQKIGITEFGRDPASYMKNGTLHARILLGISRPEGSPCQL